MTKNEEIVEQQLHAYVDGRIGPTQRSAVEAHVAANPKDAERVRSWGLQNELLHAKFDSVLDEMIPERLRYVGGGRGWMRYAAVAAWMAIGVAAGWGIAVIQYDRMSTGAAVSLARRAAMAHVVYSPEVRHPVEVGAAEQDHLVRWLSKRLGVDLKAPYLQASGYELVGGRLLPGEQGPVAQFMYQDARGQRLTLYISSRKGEQRDTAFRFSQEGRVAVFYWIDNSLGYALSGEVDKPALLSVANVVYKQLNP
jgi:anti-sigma factor RsiW